MSAGTNPFCDPLMSLFGRLNSIGGLLQVLVNQLDNHANLLKQALVKHGHDISIVGCGKSLPVTDLTGPTDNGWPFYYPSGSFDAQGEEYLRMSKVVERRESAWAVAQAYEAFETFLKDTLATFLMQRPSEADTERLLRFDKGKAVQPDRARKEYWAEFVRFAFRGRNNQELLSRLREVSPGLADAERGNPRRIDLPGWYAAASEIRHAVTHGNMRIPVAKQAVVASHSRVFPCEVDGAEVIPDLREKHADLALERFADYGFQVFKFISKATGHDWDILPRGFKPARIRT